MVALKTGKLSGPDIWPDILWTDQQWHAKRDEIREQAEAEGFGELGLHFEVIRRMDAYMSQFPSYGVRQSIMARIYPGSGQTGVLLSQDEIAYLIDRLSGVNESIGQDILVKLNAVKKGD